MNDSALIEKEARMFKKAEILYLSKLSFFLYTC
jgi:hypothetical protein